MTLVEGLSIVETARAEIALLRAERDAVAAAPHIDGVSRLMAFEQLEIRRKKANQFILRVVKEFETELAGVAAPEELFYLQNLGTLTSDPRVPAGG